MGMDSLRNEEKEKAMAEMTARFNNKELENKNELLKKIKERTKKVVVDIR